jgi:L-aspartate oxidase
VNGPEPVTETTAADVVVVGAGLAGLMTALALAPRPVVVLAKSPLGNGAASAWAQGGVAAALGADDAPSLHAADTRAAGAGLCDERAVAAVTAEAPLGIETLIRLGAPFDRAADGALDLGREGAHTRRRIVHAGGDATGRAILQTLIAAVRATPSIEVREGMVADDLVARDGRVTGVLAHAQDDPARALLFAAGAVVLATGGIGRLYAYTTNPREATGDGLAMAARAGAQILDAEFVQFHPTALAAGRDPMPLVSEAVRGEGAVLIDGRGRRFLANDPLGELAGRDRVARAIYEVLAAGGNTYLDARAAIGSEFPKRFPTVYRLCRDAGIDPRREPIPVAPAAHYHMGGVAVDLNGRTTLPGLWACGEVSSTGVHGANRLASNSLLEALVYARHVALDIANAPAEPAGAAASASGSYAQTGGSSSVLDEPALRKLMFECVGVVRSRAGLGEAIAALDRAAAAPGPLRNMLAVARLIATAALRREESRGCHFRSDAPDSHAGYARRLAVSL